MSKLRIRISFDIEGEDLSDATLQTVEIQCAAFRERLEAQLATWLENAAPDLRGKITSDDDEGEEWKEK